MKNKANKYSGFQKKILLRFCMNIVVSVLAVVVFYVFLWKQRVGNWIVWFLENIVKMPHEDAFLIYHHAFRENKEILFLITIIFLFLILLLYSFRWMTKYFNEINTGIEALLLPEKHTIALSPELQPFEQKLNAVRQALEQKEKEAALANQHKDELVMYLAHDIRTPLTSVIGYLNLLEENPDMPITERAKNMRIALEKAYRLEEMLNEFFDITRYNSRQIKIVKEPVDLYYMLVQLSDEMSPILSQHGNYISLQFNENIIVQADPDKLARVFGNILKNAAAYSYPDTPVTISVTETDKQWKIHFRNEGNTIPPEQLEMIFDKFYRLDKSRNSDSGGTGLGLAIAKDIILLHGGNISASSAENEIIFTVQLPKGI